MAKNSALESAKKIVADKQKEYDNLTVNYKKKLDETEKIINDLKNTNFDYASGDFDKYNDQLTKISNAEKYSNTLKQIIANGKPDSLIDDQMATDLYRALTKEGNEIINSFINDNINYLNKFVADAKTVITKVNEYNDLLKTINAMSCGNGHSIGTQCNYRLNCMVKDVEEAIKDSTLTI